MHRVHGSRGKVVWLPTFESDKHVKTFGGKDAKGLVVAPGGVVTPEMEAILKTIARENLVLADLGQSANITHPDGLEVAIGAMKREGISDADIDLMVRKNPAKLLGLANWRTPGRAGSLLMSPVLSLPPGVPTAGRPQRDERNTEGTHRV